MEYLVEIRTQGGDREDFWPVASYLIDLPQFPDYDAQDMYADSITAAMKKAGITGYQDHFASVSALNVVAGNAAAARDHIVQNMLKELRESGYIEDPDAPKPKQTTLEDLPEELQKAHRQFMEELHELPDQHWEFNPSYIAFLQKRLQQG
jgi:hypothetical protein